MTPLFTPPGLLQQFLRRDGLDLRKFLIQSLLNRKVESAGGHIQPKDREESLQHLLREEGINPRVVGKLGDLEGLELVKIIMVNLKLGAYSAVSEKARIGGNGQRTTNVLRELQELIPAQLVADYQVFLVPCRKIKCRGDKLRNIECVRESHWCVPVTRNRCHLIHHIQHGHVHLLIALDVRQAVVVHEVTGLETSPLKSSLPGLGNRSKTERQMRQRRYVSGTLLAFRSKVSNR